VTLAKVRIATRTQSRKTFMQKPVIFFAADEQVMVRIVRAVEVNVMHFFPDSQRPA
jgi:hypothetical protein